MKSCVRCGDFRIDCNCSAFMVTEDGIGWYTVYANDPCEIAVKRAMNHFDGDIGEQLDEPPIVLVDGVPRMFQVEVSMEPTFESIEVDLPSDLKIILPADGGNIERV